MYKDKDKQREANRQASQRRRGKVNIPLDNALKSIKGMTQGMTNEGMTESNSGTNVIPERTAQGNIRVSKPGDADYVPMCETTRAFVEGRDKRPETGKRGKDIKCFEDLPVDVQEVINRLSTTDGKIDEAEHKKRTAIAINYQYIVPKRYHSTGVA